jgi:hypothetical protein
MITFLEFRYTNGGLSSAAGAVFERLIKAVASYFNNLVFANLAR